MRLRGSRPRTTLSTRLIVASVLAATIALVTANALAYISLRRTLIERVDASLRTLRLPRRGPDANAVRRLAPTFYLEERAADGSTLDRIEATDVRGRSLRPQLSTRLDLAGTSIDPDGTAKFFTASGVDTSTRFRVKAAAFPDGRSLILAATLDDVEATLGRTLRVQVLITAAVTAFAAILAAFGVRRSLRPLTEMERAAATIAGGDRAARVAATGPRDIRELAAAFNRMVDNLDASIQAEAAASATTRRFVDDAAHELRTPITAVAAYAELLSFDAERSPTETERITRGIAAETDRLRRLIEELLFLARVDQADKLRAQTMFDLVPVALAAADTSMVVGPSWPIDLDAPDEAWCVGSAEEIRRVIDNLLSNIRTHTPPGTPARLAITRHAAAVELRVEDDGPGVPTAEVERLFDRFWRGDASRARSTGGTGLGLSIVAAVVDRHHGTVRAERNGANGVAVVVTLPGAPVPSGSPDATDAHR